MADHEDRGRPEVRREVHRRRDRRHADHEAAVVGRPVAGGVEVARAVGQVVEDVQVGQRHERRLVDRREAAALVAVGVAADTMSGVSGNSADRHQQRLGAAP